LDGGVGVASDLLEELISKVQINSLRQYCKENLLSLIGGGYSKDLKMGLVFRNFYQVS
jgi:hypothetical protein